MLWALGVMMWWTAGAGDVPLTAGRHEECDAASEPWKGTCVDACPTDQISELEKCKDECGKSATKVYWNCSQCWTTCDKDVATCEAACPADTIQDHDEHEKCVAGCRADAEGCHSGCKSAGP